MYNYINYIKADYGLKMATFTQRKDKWFVQIRRKGFPSISKSFSEKVDAEAFAVKIENDIALEVSNFASTPSAYKLPVTNRDLLLIYKSSKKRSSSSGLEHTLTEAEFMDKFNETDGKCTLSGLFFSGGKSDSWRVRPFFPSLDRIDSTKGYTKDNVRFVSTAVNLALSDWGDEILKTIAFGIVSKSCTAK